MAQQPDLAALARSIRGGASTPPPPGMNLADLARQIRGEKAPASGGASPHDALIDKYAAEFGVPQDLVRSVINVESGGKRKIVSGKGAQGLMQLMPGTAAEMGVTDPFDPEQNIRGGIGYLKKMLDRFGGDEDKALAAYNAGPGPVERHGGIPPYRETQAYVPAVQAGRGAFRRADPASTPGQPAPSTPEAAPRQSVVVPPKPAPVFDLNPADPMFAPVDVLKTTREGGAQIGRAGTGAVQAVKTGDPKVAANAVSDAIEGVMTLGSPALIPAAMVSLGWTAATIAVATAASQAAEATAKRFGFDEAYQRLAGNIAAVTAAGVGAKKVLASTGVAERPAWSIGQRIGEFIKKREAGKPKKLPDQAPIEASFVREPPVSETAPLIRERQILDAPAGEAYIRPEVPLPPRAAQPPPVEPAAAPSPAAVLPQPRTLPAEIAVPRPAERAIPPTVAEGQWPPVKVEAVAPNSAVVARSEFEARKQAQQEALGPRPTGVKAQPTEAEQVATKEALMGQIEALDNELGHPFGDRDDFSAMLQTDPADLDEFALRSTLKELQDMMPRAKMLARKEAEAEKPDLEEALANYRELEAAVTAAVTRPSVKLEPLQAAAWKQLKAIREQFGDAAAEAAFNEVASKEVAPPPPPPPAAVPPPVAAPPVPPAVEPPTAKAPWEMRRDEFVATKTGTPREDVNHPPGSKWDDFDGKLSQQHANAVATQLIHGGTVPPEVLADYPDLAPAPPPVVATPSGAEVAKAKFEAGKGEKPVRADGRLDPQVGDEVYQTVRGFGGAPAYIYGTVIKARGGLRVKTTGSADTMGIASGPVGKTYRLDENWTVKGDPEIKRREQRREQKEAELKAQREAEEIEWRESRAALSAKAISEEGHTALTVDTPAGSKVVNYWRDDEPVVETLEEVHEKYGPVVGGVTIGNPAPDGTWPGYSVMPPESVVTPSEPPSIAGLVAQKETAVRAGTVAQQSAVEPAASEPVVEAPKAEAQSELPAIPDIPWQGPKPGSPEHAALETRHGEIRARDEKLRGQEVELGGKVDKTKRGSKIRESLEARLRRIQEERNSYGDEFDRLSKTRYDANLQIALADPKTPPEVKLAVAEAILARRKQPRLNAYDALKAEAERRLLEIGSTPEEAQAEAVRLAARLVESPLYEGSWFDKSIANSKQLIKERRELQADLDAYDALEAKYGKSRGYVDYRKKLKDATAGSRKQYLKDAEEQLKTEKAHVDKETAESEAAAKIENDAAMNDAQVWAAKGQLFYRRVNAEKGKPGTWVPTKGERLEIDGMPPEFTFWLARVNGNWIITEESSGLSAFSGPDKPEVITEGSARILKHKDQLPKIVAKELENAPPRPELRNYEKPTKAKKPAKARPAAAPEAPAQDALIVESPEEAAAIVKEEIKHVIDTKGLLNAKAIQEKVLATLSGELAGAEKFQAAMTLGRDIYGKAITEARLSVGDKLPSEDYNAHSARIRKAEREVEKPSFLEAKGVVTIEIPGDGTFTIDRNPTAIRTVMKRISSMGSKAWADMTDTAIAKRGSALLDRADELARDRSAFDARKAEMEAKHAKKRSAK